MSQTTKKFNEVADAFFSIKEGFMLREASYFMLLVNFTANLV